MLLGSLKGERIKNKVGMMDLMRNISHSFGHLNNWPIVGSVIWEGLCGLWPWWQKLLWH